MKRLEEIVTIIYNITCSRSRATSTITWMSIMNVFKVNTKSFIIMEWDVIESYGQNVCTSSSLPSSPPSPGVSTTVTGRQGSPRQNPCRVIQSQQRPLIKCCSTWWSLGWVVHSSGSSLSSKNFFRSPGLFSTWAILSKVSIALNGTSVLCFAIIFLCLGNKKCS